jgi:SAM-dependent methyltransferase
VEPRERDIQPAPEAGFAAADDWQDANLELWDEWALLHEGTPFYDVEGFKRGRSTIRPFEREEIGDVTGKDLLHLQCHFGMDTLSYARMGARVTGADFSPNAVAIATRLAGELSLDDARFVRSRVEDLPANLEGDFDIVYTSRGVIGWLEDLERWAEVIAHFLRPGGFLYLHEGHPAMWVLDDERDDQELRIKYPYWERDRPYFWPVVGSYADPKADVQARRSYNWIHSLGEVVTVLAQAGLRIEWLREHPFLDWPLPFLVPAEDRTWVLPAEGDREMPLSFSLKASKPA